MVYRTTWLIFNLHLYKYLLGYIVYIKRDINRGGLRSNHVVS
nr:MAG TPA: hypothetical protein [Caudoviricetes sp.]